MTIGEKLLRFRKVNNMTQKELSEKCGCSMNTISRYENGERMPTIDTLERIAAVFNISTAELLADVDMLSYDSELKNSVESTMQLMADQLRAGDDLSDEMQANFSKLNTLGKHVAVDVVEYLTTKEKYTTPDESSQNAPD